MKHFRRRFDVPISEDKVSEAPLYRPDQDSEEIKYLRKRREKLGKALYLCRINRDVLHFLRHGGFLHEIGRDRVFPTEYAAIAEIFKQLDYDICLSCTARIFNECAAVAGPETASSY